MAQELVYATIRVPFFPSGESAIGHLLAHHGDKSGKNSSPPTLRRMHTYIYILLKTYLYLPATYSFKSEVTNPSKSVPLASLLPCLIAYSFISHATINLKLLYLFDLGAHFHNSVPWHQQEL
jgi:hypothetical protein